MTAIQITVQGGVRTITLTRPESLNALTEAMHWQLEDAFNAFAAADDEQICVLTGTGRAFCAGSDLKEAAAIGSRGYPAHGYAGLIERFDCPKPIIAAVNGLALGGGFELALACDIVIATESASFGLPEPLVGAIALGGGLHRLVRQAPLKQAMGMILAARRVGAAEVERMGLVTEVVPDGELDAAVARWCADILRASPVSVRASKELALRGLAAADVQAAMAAQPDDPAFIAWRTSDDAREGPRAFAEKRPPNWRGK
ncbi:MAG: hypothetical protein RIQ99_2101 [Pseudomonadota bacterium]|jgi:crotonobetainyl-CoA hydratase